MMFAAQKAKKDPAPSADDATAPTASGSSSSPKKGSKGGPQPAGSFVTPSFKGSGLGAGPRHVNDPGAFPLLFPHHRSRPG